MSVTNTLEQSLVTAARFAQQAPSILNTQPWRWMVHGTTLDLLADRARQVQSIDPDGRLLTLSCGCALHHARVGLAAAGHECEVDRQPDPEDPDLLATIRIVDTHAPRTVAVNLARAVRDRRTDRRPIASTSRVRDDVISALARAAEREQAVLCRLLPDQLAFLAIAAKGAAVTELKDDAYRSDLEAWTRQYRSTGAGITPETVTPSVPRPVPQRDFVPDGEVSLHPGFGDDAMADYLVIATRTDDLVDWLRAGEATSAVWLAGTNARLAMSPMSDVVEVAGARSLLRSMIEQPGHPQLVLRVGNDAQPVPPAASPRRDPAEAIDIT